MTAVTAPPTGITSRNEVPAFFRAGDEILFGLLTRPPEGDGNSALIMVPSAERLGYRNRVGVMLAHRLAARGHQAFRFNYHGCGESTGKAGRFRLDDLFTEDAVGAAAWLRERGVKRFLYSGSCFGARTALRAAAEEPEAAGVIVAAMPTTDYASGDRGIRDTAAAPMSSLARQVFRRKTFRDLRDRDRRRMYLEAVRHKLRGLRPRSRSAGADGLEISPVLLRSLTALVERRVPILFLYGERDTAFQEFLQAQDGPIGELLHRAGDAVQVRVIPGILHGWGSIPAGETAVDLMTEWVARIDRPAPRS
jgi:pimeloyl-ACP methyl ester carboxylesterase